MGIAPMKLLNQTKTFCRKSRLSAYTAMSLISHACSSFTSVPVDDLGKKSRAQSNEMVLFLNSDLRFRTSRAFNVEKGLFEQSFFLLETLTDNTDRKFVSKSLEGLMKFCKEEQVLHVPVSERKPQAHRNSILLDSNKRLNIPIIRECEKFVFDYINTNESRTASFLDDLFILGYGKDYEDFFSLISMLTKIEKGLLDLCQNPNKPIQLAIRKIAAGLKYISGVIIDKENTLELSDTNAKFLENWKNNYAYYNEYKTIFSFDNEKKVDLLDAALGYFITGMSNLLTEIATLKASWNDEFKLLTLISDLRLFTNLFNLFLNFSKLQLEVTAQGVELLQIRFNPSDIETFVLKNWLKTVKESKLPLKEGFDMVMSDKIDPSYLKQIIKTESEKATKFLMPEIDFCNSEELIFDLNASIMSNFFIHNKVSDFYDDSLQNKKESLKKELLEVLAATEKSQNSMISSIAAVSQKPVFANLLDIKEGSDLKFDENNLHILDDSNGNLARLNSSSKSHKLLEAITQEYPGLLSNIKSNTMILPRFIEPLKSYREKLEIKDAEINEIEFLYQCICLHISTLPEPLQAAIQEQVEKLLTDLSSKIDFQRTFQSHLAGDQSNKVMISESDIRQIIIVPVQIITKLVLGLSLETGLGDQITVEAKTIEAIVDGLNAFSLIIQTFFECLNKNSGEQPDIQITYFSHTAFSEGLYAQTQSAKGTISIRDYINSAKDDSYFCTEKVSVEAAIQLIEENIVRFVSERYSSYPISTQCIANISKQLDHLSATTKLEFLMKVLSSQEIDKDLNCFELIAETPETFDDNLEKFLNQSHVNSYEGLVFLKYLINNMLANKLVTLEAASDIAQSYCCEDGVTPLIFNESVLEILKIFKANQKIETAISAAEPKDLRDFTESMCNFIETTMKSVENKEKYDEVVARYSNYSSIPDRLVNFLNNRDKLEDLEAFKKDISSLQLDNYYIQIRKDVINSLKYIYELLVSYPKGKFESQYRSYFIPTAAGIESRLVDIVNTTERLELGLNDVKVKILGSFKSIPKEMYTKIYGQNNYHYGMDVISYLFETDFSSSDSLVQNYDLSKIYQNNSNQSTLTTFSKGLYSSMLKNTQNLESLVKLLKQDVILEMSDTTEANSTNKNELSDLVSSPLTQMEPISELPLTDKETTVTNASVERENPSEASEKPLNEENNDSKGNTDVIDPSKDKNSSSMMIYLIIAFLMIGITSIIVSLIKKYFTTKGKNLN